MGGDHGHGHGPPYTIPDYRIYKVENAPELLKVQQALAVKGLKDPWLRNEVWRYDRKIWGNMDQPYLLTKFFFRGAKWGFLAAVITVAIEQGMKKLHGGDEHGHGHGGHH